MPRAIRAVGLCCALLAGCADTTADSPAVYVVRPADTLYSIAWRHDLDYRDLARWNDLGADFRIAVGQVLVLGPGHAAPRPTAAETAAPKWVWPTERLGKPRAQPGGGILLPGRLGQDVCAAAAGRVVYTGSGLRGYGNLIIIKHGDTWLSAYGHNREMLVHEGQEVARGQVIAHMGEDAQESAVLYFEIRRNGRPVDPLPILSR